MAASAASAAVAAVAALAAADAGQKWRKNALSNALSSTNEHANTRSWQEPMKRRVQWGQFNKKVRKSEKLQACIFVVR